MNGLMILIPVSAIAGIFVGYIVRYIYSKSHVNSVEQRLKKMLEDTQREIEVKKKEGFLEIKEEMHKARIKFDDETKERKQEILQLEKRLNQKEGNLDRKAGILEKKERENESKLRYIESKDRNLQQEEKKIQHTKEEQKKILERLARITPEEAKNMLLKNMEEEAKKDSVGIIRQIVEQTKEVANKKAREILSQAIQRCAAEYTAEVTVSSVSLPNEDMKGRVIGREGRNIHAFEATTGVNLIVDDTPEAITLSAFDGVRREIARVALERLIMDGRIHPARIEEIVVKVKKEMEAHLSEVGQQTTFDLEIQGLHPELIKTIGKFKYRTSYGQNVLQHSIEVAKASAILAYEIGVDAKMAKRAGLLHDLGKVLDNDMEGPHAKIGAELARKYGENSRIVNAIAAHHEDVPFGSVEAILVAAADAVSASRPGARMDSLEHYLKRLEKLERLAYSFNGVEKAYAIQAGREIRIIVEPKNIDDNGCVQLANDVANKIRSELEYPGQIKVTVIRETRSIAVAK